MKLQEPSTIAMADSFTEVSRRKTTDERLCLVCSDRSDGAHFGVDSCRACAAFFRRSIAMKKKYVCRQGGHSCKINKTVRFMCRKCRFGKCLQAGMLAENVQAHDGKTDSLNAPSPSFAPPATENKPPPICAAIVRPQPVFLPSSSSNSFLHTIHVEYMQMTALRQSSELAIYPSTDLKSIFANSTVELRPCTFAILDRILKAAVTIIADFCNKTFPEFMSLNHDDKWTLFRNFFSILFYFECSHRTVKSGFLGTSKRHISVTTVWDLDKDHFFQEAPTSHNAQKVFMDLVQEKGHSTAMGRMHALVARLDLTDIEYAAFVALCLWSPSISSVSEKVHEVCIASRENIFRELHHYYRHTRQMEEYSIRLGDIMGLFSSIQSQTQRMREEMELYSLFDIFEKNSFIYNLLTV